MAVSLLVYAPGVEAEVVTELGLTLGKGVGTAVATAGWYGIEKRQAAAWVEGLPDLIAQLDPSHYWAIIRVGLQAGAAWIGAKGADKAFDLAVQWAVKHKRGTKKAKIRLYGPDGTLIKEDDA